MSTRGNGGKPNDMKSKRFLRLFILMLSLIASSPGIFANLTEDYGYIFVGSRTYVDANPDHIWSHDWIPVYDGWTEMADGSLISPELNLSDCGNPYLITTLSDNDLKKWVSSDGVNFTQLESKRSDKIYLAQLPQDTRFIKLKDSYDYTFYTIVHDLGYGADFSEVITPEFLNGTYDPTDQSYTSNERVTEYGYSSEYVFRFRFNIPESSVYNTIRYLEVTDGGSGFSLIDVKFRLKSGKEATTQATLGSGILIPMDAESVEFSFTDTDKKLTELKTNIKRIVLTLSSSNTCRPSNDLNDYIDIDGDGSLETFAKEINSRIVKPIIDIDGNLRYIDSGIKFGVNKLLGYSSEGSLLGYTHYTLENDTFVKFTDPSNPTVLYETENSIQKITSIDINLDGRNEYYISTNLANEYSLLSILPDGSVVVSDLKTLTPEEYAGVRSELKLTTGGETIPGMGDMFGRDPVASIFNPSETVDINSDGLPDFLDASRGDYLLNLGDGRFVKSTFGNKVVLRDMDGDGVNDILICETATGDVKLYNGTDTSQEPETLFTGMKIDYLYCRDVDNDGDVDVIALINGYGEYSEQQDCYILISENLGGNKFRRREHYIEGNMSWSASSPQDLDADGKYELLGNKSNEGQYTAKIASPSQVIVEKISDRTYNSNLPVTIKSSSDSAWAVFIDDYSKEPIKMYGAGTRPAKPAAPTLNFNEATRRLTVSWETGKDAETPSADLTYELRIGTAPGLGDIAAAQALPDGTRKCLRNGSNGYSTFAVYNVESWPEGKIYISYQVIDADYSGSEFSAPAVFEKSSPACDFAIHNEPDLATWVPAEVELAFAPAAGASYEWDFADAEVLNLDPATHKARILFPTYGTKEISLTARSANGVETTTTKTIYVSPLHYENSSLPSSGASFDIDGDGYAELFSGGKFYVVNENGESDTYKKSFNTSTGISTFHVADIDGDGFADIFDKNNILMNYGDGDMEKSQAAAPATYADWTLYDFNNDGKLDARNALNNGDYLTTTEAGWELLPEIRYSKSFYYDFNRDGLIDIVYFDTNNTNKSLYIFENIDGYTFKSGVMVPEITVEPVLIEDLDGDGVADYVFCNASYAFGVTFYDEFIVIKWGAGGETKLECPDGDPFRGVIGAFDYNNDGMKDLCVNVQKAKGGIIIINPTSKEGTFVAGDSYYGAELPTTRLRNGTFKTYYGIFNAAPNERPLPPSGFRSTQNEQGVVIEWNPGSDKETPTKGLRYNISIKHKGKTGKDAYLISPLNGGNASAALPYPIYLPSATKFTIPMASIPAGEYEVSVQSVDWQNDVSEFSEVYNLTVRPQALAKLPTSGMVGQAVEMAVLTNTGDADTDFGADVEVERIDATHYNLTWSSEGLKEIKLNGETAEIYIYPGLDASFSIDSDVIAGSFVALSDIKGEGGKWEYSFNGGDFKPLSQSDDTAAIESRADNQKGIRFMKEGAYIVRHTISESYGTAACEQPLQAKAYPVEIAQVSVEDGHFIIEWNNVPERATDVRIYKETSTYNTFELLGECPVTSEGFIDRKSNPAIKTARYKLSYVLPYGETALSEAHKPMHVQVNHGPNSSINLAWNNYEGLEVESYRVLKGTTPENMAMYDILSGSLTSFTDQADNAADNCYSIEVVSHYAANVKKHAAGKRAAEEGPRSNVVWGRDAAPAVLATSIVITPASGSTQFDGREVLPLQARILPANATFNRVNWEIVSGSENMEIDNLGNVTAKEFGKAVVRATAVDGSGVYGEVELDNNEILLTWLEFTAWPEGHQLAQGETFQYQILTEPENATEKPVWESSDTSVAVVDQNGYVQAIGLGETIISVRGQSDGVYTRIPLTVTYPIDFVHVDDFHITPESATAKVGDQVQFRAIVTPENATNPNVVWSVEPGYEDVVEIFDSGLANIIGEGEARIRAALQYQPERYLIAIIVSTNGDDGIDAVLDGSNGPWSVYTVDGKLLNKEATKEDIRQLYPGLYVIGGKLIYLTRKL